MVEKKTKKRKYFLQRNQPEHLKENSKIIEKNSNKLSLLFEY